MLNNDKIIHAAVCYMNSKLKENGCSQSVTFFPDAVVNYLSGESGSINIHQQHQGLQVFGMTSILYFNKTGTFFDAKLKVTPVTEVIDAWPKVSAIDAVTFAIREALESAPGTVYGASLKRIADLSSFTPYIVYKIGHLISGPTLLSKGPFRENIPAHLVYVLRAGVLRLAWHVIITMPDLSGQFKLLISADHHPPVIFDISNELCNAALFGNIYRFNPGHSVRQKTRLTGIKVSPVQQSEVAAELCGEAAFVSSDASFPEEFTERISSHEFYLNPEVESYHQLSLNAYYFCQVLHDFFESLGFNEFSGNFQRSNYECFDGGNDAVEIKISLKEIAGTAGMTTDVDGKPPLMFLGPHKNGRHTAVDFDIVAHEYCHGITNRIVGGRYNASALSGLQSKGMGEGWSDYFALTVQNYLTGKEKNVIGAWLENCSCGSRRAAYDNSYPYDFSSLPEAGSFHQIGEVWCAALMKMTRLIVENEPLPQEGYRVSLQLVMDGLKLTPADPTFLEGRDAILMAAAAAEESRAIDNACDHSIIDSVWEAFTYYGMGKKASCGDGGLTEIVPDFGCPER